MKDERDSWCGFHNTCKGSLIYAEGEPHVVLCGIHSAAKDMYDALDPILLELAAKTLEASVGLQANGIVMALRGKVQKEREAFTKVIGQYDTGGTL